MRGFSKDERQQEAISVPPEISATDQLAISHEDYMKFLYCCEFKHNVLQASHCKMFFFFPVSLKIMPHVVTSKLAGFNVISLNQPNYIWLHQQKSF